MSQFYDQASLVMIPSGYKNGKVYSQKPLSADGELTFTRASNATRVNADGLIEKVRTNYCRYSQDFASWSLLGGATRTTGVTDPNGGTTAATIGNIPSGNFSDGILIANNPMAIGSEPITASIWLKGSGTISFAIERGITGDYFFFFQDITLTSTWTRYSISGSAAGSRAGFSFYVANRTGTTATSMDVAFAQVEHGDIATDYIPTTTAGVSVGPVSGLPRLDYSGGCPSLLLEPQRTNQILQSESFGSASWNVFNASISSNVSATLDPQGYYGADKLVEDSSSAYHDVDQVQTYTAAAHTISVFAKSAGRDHIFLQHFDGVTFFTSGTFNLANGTVSGSGSIEAYSNGWYRCSFTATTASGTGKSYINLSNGTSGNYAGNGTDGAYLWGAQLEAGSYATSYIPTLGSAVSRNADSAYKTGISSLIGQTEGTLFVEVDLNHTSIGNTYILQVFQDSSNRILLYRSYGDVVGCYILKGAASVYDTTTALSYTGRIKIAFAYKSGDIAFYINGTQIGTSSATYTAFASLADLNIDSNNGLENGYYTYKQVLLFKTRLTNAQLAELTAL